MPSYKYRVLLDGGRIARGKILALNKSHAIESLKNENVQPIAIKRMKETSKRYKKIDYNKLKKAMVKQSRHKTSSANKVDLKNITFKQLKEIDLHPFSRVSHKDIISFVNDFYILKKSNFNNIQALESLIDSTENPVFKDAIEDVLIEVQSGERIYKAMEAYPKIFPLVFRNFVRVGEESGNLDVALLYARDYIESSFNLSKRVKGAIIPRVIQFIGIMGAMIAAVIIGVPILQTVYDMFDSTQEIPKATMWMLGFAKWFVGNWYYIIAFIVTVVVIVLIYRSTPRGRYNVDRLMLSNFLFGPLYRNIVVSRFFKAMLLNLKNGMRIQESLEVSKNVTTNYYFLSAIETGKANTLAGRSWIDPFREMKLFRPMISEMLKIGMRTDLSEMMDKVNVYLESEIEESLARFVKLLPEVAYIFVGIALIAFTLTVLVPVINVYMGGFIDIPT